MPTAAEVLPAAAARGPLVLEAGELAKDFRLARGPRGEDALGRRAASRFGLYRSAVVALVGESGSGKSTVAQLLAGQERPTRGRDPARRRAGAPVGAAQRSAPTSARCRWSSRTRSRRSTRSTPCATRSSVPRPPASARSRARRRRGRARAAARAGAPDAGRSSSSRSTRTSSRAGSASAWRSRGRSPSRPRVLLADEPVSMLDVSIRLEVLDLIDELRAQFELAVLYITHDIASARYFADETLVMYAGEIVERGPSEDADAAAGAPLHASCSSPRHPTRTRLGEPSRGAPGRGRRGRPGARCSTPSAAASARAARSRTSAAAPSRRRCCRSARSVPPPAGGSTWRPRTCSRNEARERSDADEDLSPDASRPARHCAKAAAPDGRAKGACHTRALQRTRICSTKGR